MATITLKRLTLVNFKGVRNLTLDFNHVTNIFGDNGTGKTTVFDSFMFLLFGKDSTDRKDFEIKTLDKNNKVIPQIEHEVSAVIEVNGEEIVIKRILKENWVKKRGSLDAEFSGNVTEYFWNEVPKQQKEYQDKIASILDETVFKMITNPLAFNSMKWPDKRSALIELVGNVSDAVIAGNDKMFVDLLAKLTNKTMDEYKKQLAVQRKLLNDNIKSIPTRVDEVSRNTPEALDFENLKKEKTVLENSLESIQSQIDDKTKAFDTILERRNTVANEVFEIKSKLQNIEFETKQTINRSIHTGTSEIDHLNKELTLKKGELQSYENGLTSLGVKLNDLKYQYQCLTDDIADKRTEWVTENERELSFNDTHFACPTCKRDFEASDVEAKKEELKNNFIKTKNDNLLKISAEGKSLSEQKSAVENEIKGLEIRIENGNESVKSVLMEIMNIEEKINHTSTTSKNSEPQDETVLVQKELDRNADYQNLKIVLAEKETALQNHESINVDDLKSAKSSVEAEIAEINRNLAIEDQIKSSNKRIEELQGQESSLAQQISDLEKEQFVIDKFIKRKIDTLESLINEKFSFVKFKLFETQINGAEVECCHTLIDGVPFSDANTASKINAGLDIINTLCEYYKITAPIFIDNRESIVNIIDCKSQIVNLIVSKPDKKLRVA